MQFCKKRKIKPFPPFLIIHVRYIIFNITEQENYHDRKSHFRSFALYSLFPFG